MKKNTEETTHRLIAEDATRLPEILNQTKQIYPKIQDIAKAYEALKLGPFTNEVYLEIISGGLSGILKQYHASIEKMLDNMGVHIASLRAKIREDAYAPVNAIKAAYQPLMQSAHSTGLKQINFPLEYITIVEGAPTVTADKKELLMETYCRTYISTSGPEKAMHDNLENLATALTAVFNELHKVEYPLHLINGSIGFLDPFLQLSEDRKTAKVRAENVTAIVNYKQRAAKYGG